MTVNLLEWIARARERLSRSEAQVAAWVLANPRQAVEAAISDVARAAQVSEPTVVRFCRSVGTSGFREFKTRLVAALSQPETHVHEDVNPGDATVDAVGKVLDSAIRTLIDVRALAATMPFEAAVAAMENARQLVFVGLGASGFVARDASHKFFRLGVPCATALDGQTILQSAAIARPGDVFVATSHTGAWPAMVRAMELACARGATVIALTAPHAPLATAASLVFECHPPEDTNLFTPMSSRLAQLALLDALQVTLALRIGSAAEESLRLSKEVLAGPHAARPQDPGDQRSS